MGLFEECAKRESDKAEIEKQLDEAVREIIFSTTAELLGDQDDPEDVLERYIIENGLDRKEGKEKSK